MKLNWGERLAVNNPIRPMQQQLEIQWFRRMLPLAPGGSILEVGCGRGMGARLIHKTFRPSLLHIQDLDMEMIHKAKYRHAPPQEKGVSLSVGDAAFLPFKAGTFDAVFGFGVLHHVPDWRSAIREIARILKAGGVYYTEELFPSLYQNRFTKHILLHPEEDRFQSKDLREAFGKIQMTLSASLELPKLGILAVVVKP
jgi:ubiquinone/menaquinone biosynthesis C-methylase UbiE